MHNPAVLVGIFAGLVVAMLSWEVGRVVSKLDEVIGHLQNIEETLESILGTGDTDDST